MCGYEDDERDDVADVPGALLLLNHSYRATGGEVGGPQPLLTRRPRGRRAGTEGAQGVRGAALTSRWGPPEPTGRADPASPGSLVCAVRGRVPQEARRQCARGDVPLRCTAVAVLGSMFLFGARRWWCWARCSSSVHGGGGAGLDVPLR